MEMIRKLTEEIAKKMFGDYRTKETLELSRRYANLLLKKEEIKIPTIYGEKEITLKEISEKIQK